MSVRDTLRDPWFWIGLGGVALALVSIYAEERGWVNFLGDGGTVVGIILGLVGLLRASTRNDVGAVRGDIAGMRGEMREGFQGMREGVRGVREGVEGVRGDLREQTSVLRAILDRLSVR